MGFATARTNAIEPAFEAEYAGNASTGYLVRSVVGCWTSWFMTHQTSAARIYDENCASAPVGTEAEVSQGEMARFHDALQVDVYRGHSKGTTSIQTEKVLTWHNASIGKDEVDPTSLSEDLSKRLC